MQPLFDFLYAAGISYWCLLTVVLLRDHRELIQARAFALLALAQSAELFLWSSVPLPETAEALLLFLARLTPAFIWLFCIALFDDDFRLKPLYIGLFGVIVLIDLLLLVAGPVALRYGMTAISSALALHVVYRLAGGWSEDLIEPRRRLRFLFVAAIVIVLLADLLTDIAIGLDWRPDGFNLVFTGARIALLFAGALWLLQVNREALVFEQTPSSGSNGPELSPALGPLKEKLDQALAEGVFLIPDMSVGALAERLGAPEQRVRALINQALGFRNFRAFLNEHRMRAVKAALADPRNGDQPIVTIALDCGFASLASFNRVFKATTGTTPTQYRTKAHQSLPQN